VWKGLLVNSYPVNSFIVNYLTYKQRLVKIKEVLYQKRKIICGIPESSDLGPLFLILYTYNKLNLNIDDQIITCVDDT
jgi:hypothetical protein